MLAFRDRYQRPCSYAAELVDGRLAEVDERMRDLRKLKRNGGRGCRALRSGR